MRSGARHGDTETRKHGDTETSNLPAPFAPSPCSPPRSRIHGEIGGCVALDRNGRLAGAGISTGGTANKLPGRVGNSPLIGAGLYADNQTGGCSTTGWGK